MPQLNAISLLLWGLLGTLIVVGLTLLVRAERKRFRERGKGFSWLVLRLSSLPIAGGSILLAIGSNQRVGNAEPLLVFLISLVTAVPLVYFGMHWLVGKFVSPKLGAGESLWVACSGLLMVAGPASLISVAAPFIHIAAGTAMSQGIPPLRADPAPMPHRIVAARQLIMPSQAVVHVEQWQFPPDIEIVRLDLEYAPGQHVPLPMNASSPLCRAGNDIHLFWTGNRSLPRWRLYWKRATGSIRHTDWTTSVPPEPATAFEPVWATDRIRLPVMLPGAIVQFIQTGNNGQQSVLDPPQPEAPDNCLPQEIPLNDANPNGRVTELVLRTHAPLSMELWREAFKRPD